MTHVLSRAATTGAIVAVGVLALATSAHAAQGDPPPEVFDSLQPGGAAFDEAVELNTAETGAMESMRTTEVEQSITFGEARQSEYLTLAEEGPDYVTPTDFSERGDYWLAVEYVDGEPYSTIEVSSAGEFLTLDGWLPEEVEALDRAPADAIIATDGQFEQAFAITDGGTVAHALNAITAEFIGGDSVAVSELRGMKAKQLADAIAAEGDVEPGAIGGAFSGTSVGASPNALWFWVTGIGLVVVGVSAFVLGRTRKKARID